MRHPSLVSILILIVTSFPALPAGTPQTPKPFTQNQVQGMVRDGLGDETGAKALV
jgi:hypothetical protein